jgi:tetratricopeptide (TPR) repeat protein
MFQSKLSNAGASMRRTTSRLTLACALLAVAAPALGASPQAHEDCDADDADRNIAGCTLIIQDPSEGAHMHSIALVGRALAYMQKGDGDRAEADFTFAIELDANNALAFNDRGMLARERGDVDRAIADFTRAIAIEALPHSDLPGSGHVNIHAYRALAYQAKGELDRAIADFDQAVQLDPADVDLREQRARAFIAKNEPDRALPDLDAVIRLDPARAFAHFARGTIRYERYIRTSPWIEQRDLDGALADLDAAILLSPQSAEIYYTRGLAFVMDGKRDRAAADFAKAAQLDPNDAQIAAMHKRYMSISPATLSSGK